MKNLKIILPVVLAIILALVGYGVYFYLKPMTDSTKKNAEFSLSVAAFLDAFSSNPSQSDSLYKDKIVQLDGKVSKNESNDSTTILIFDEGGNAIIVATCAAQKNVNTRQLKTGDSIVLKGLYKGYIEGDELFGTPSEIKLDQCIILP